MKRRALLGALPLLAAPAIIRPGLLMRISSLLWRPERGIVAYRVEGYDQFGRYVEEYITVDSTALVTNASLTEVSAIHLIAG